MLNMRVFKYFIILQAVFVVTSALYCLTCDDIQEARSCGSVEKCSTGEVCYSTQLITSSGRIYRKMGCRHATTCKNGVILGKRHAQRHNSSDLFASVHDKSFTQDIDGKDEISKRSSDATICDECCNSDLCQTSLCSDKDAFQLGPVCFNCDAQLPSELCTKIDRCDADESCYRSWSTQFGSKHLQMSGCTFKTTCGHYHIPQGSRDACWNCCDTDLCNDDCTTQNVQNVGNTTPGVCIDHTPAITCQQARTVVCQDKNHAHNAGCSNYCGFC